MIKEIDKKMFTLSDEQELFVEQAKTGKNILVDACIGSGKTTAIQILCDELSQDKKILYLTYNKLLKIDARSKIKGKNVTVTNYHGFAYMCLRRMEINAGVQDLIQTFIKEKPRIPFYDILILDEYQDIELELSLLLEMVKNVNPEMQIVAVGDMQQKIYDKTTLKVEEFVHKFLGDYINLEFTKCFRLSAELAAKLGRIWKKTIIGVNENCKVEIMEKDQAVDFLSQQDPCDVLCLGSRTGALSDTLNQLEELYPETYNKQTVYASISDRDSTGSTEPTKDTAIFTTYDSSKGLERSIVVIFDFTEDYWKTRIDKPQQSYEILRNIFCVAASRGKDHVIFVNDDRLLSEKTLSTEVEVRKDLTNMEISEMFDFKYKEDIEECYSLIERKRISREDDRVINIVNKDGMIDLSPCIGIYQEASFFNGYSIDESIEFHLTINSDKKYLYTDQLKNSSVEQKVLFLTALETRQNRYLNQVQVPFISDDGKREICERLASIFNEDEEVQKICALYFSDKRSGPILFSAMGMVDVLKNDTVYELKFVSELSHEHFLQCAAYVIALGVKKGILWNVRNNEMYEIKIPSKKKFMDAVTNAITKNYIKKYNKPAVEQILFWEKLIELNEGRKCK